MCQKTCWTDTLTFCKARCAGTGLANKTTFLLFLPTTHRLWCSAPTDSTRTFSHPPQYYMQVRERFNQVRRIYPYLGELHFTDGHVLRAELMMQCSVVSTTRWGAHHNASNWHAPSLYLGSVECTVTIYLIVLYNILITHSLVFHWKDLK